MLLKAARCPWINKRCVAAKHEHGMTELCSLNSPFSFGCCEKSRCWKAVGFFSTQRSTFDSTLRMCVIIFACAPANLSEITGTGYLHTACERVWSHESITQPFEGTQECLLSCEHMYLCTRKTPLRTLKHWWDSFHIDATHHQWHLKWDEYFNDLVEWGH